MERVQSQQLLTYWRKTRTDVEFLGLFLNLLHSYDHCLQGPLETRVFQLKGKGLD